MQLEISKEMQRTLKSNAHHLDPVVTLGNKGLTEAVLAEIDTALSAHELIKVKLRGMEKEDRQTAIATIADTLEAATIAHIGFVAVFYRPKPEDKKSK